MEVIGVAAGVVGTSITFIGVFWTVVFGPRNLVDIMTARQEKPGGARRYSAARQDTAQDSATGSAATTFPAMVSHYR